ncbi:MAG: DEAD/DEAH box helicase, partial [Prochloraceae cyanobacterium]
TIPSPPPRNVPSDTPQNSPVRVIRAIESKLKILDDNQQKIAFEIPKGPQRLRGLAGTGKTALFAKRVAKIHARYPDWQIAFVFFTQSLYAQIIGLIKDYYTEMTEEDPDWSKIHVLHSWGGKEQPGFYNNLCKKVGIKPISVTDTNNLGMKSPAKAFEYVCTSLEKDVDKFPVCYNVVVIDEGQDLPASFYRLSYQTLTEEKRFYWAYDEAQGIGSLIVPKPDQIWGKTAEGESIVDLRGSYKGGILKTHIMKRCYRTPRLLLMTAHAINMGLFREKGALQGLTNKKDWNDLGYEIKEGNFTQVGNPITITRLDSLSPHPIDNKDFEFPELVQNPLFVKSFKSEREEMEWIGKQVLEDINNGFQPKDILITPICGNWEKDYLAQFQTYLAQLGIKSYIAGSEKRSIFSKEDNITISNIFRAKGNEAWKVYVPRFHYVTNPLHWKKETELHKRNEAFVALTRAKVWCVLTGIRGPIFAELKTAIEQYPFFTFPAFNKKSLQRVTDDN